MCPCDHVRPDFIQLFSWRKGVAHIYYILYVCFHAGIPWKSYIMYLYGLFQKFWSCGLLTKPILNKQEKTELYAMIMHIFQLGQRSI